VGVRDSNGTLLGFNDDWQQAEPGQRIVIPFEPTDPNEAALVLQLSGGAYTAVVNSADGGTGTAVVEVYDLQ
jgi:hypothetical protein